MKLSLLRAIPLVVAAVAFVPGRAIAQATSVAAPETSSPSTPRWWMVGSGIVLFGFAYVPVVVVGATSGLSADRSLLIPIAGPWLDLTQRPGCKPADSCPSEESAKVLVVVDGVFQALGALTAFGGLLATTHEATVHVAPAQIGAGGYGVMALGSF
jgi:hypothetical protein